MTIVSISSLYNPLKLFGVAGVALLLAGLALTMGPLLHDGQVQEVPEASVYRLLTALVLWVVGLQSVVCGIVGTSFARLPQGGRGDVRLRWALGWPAHLEISWTR